MCDHGGNKVAICHFPNGNPGNYRTIYVNQNAAPEFINRGDYMGSCEDNCATICDDSNPCTEDVDSSASTCVCLPPNIPVDCDDSNLCTIDSCDAVAGGCVNQPIVCAPLSQCHVAGSCANGICGNSLARPDGTPCDDGDAATTNDVCTTGVCAGASSAGPCDGLADGDSCDDGDAATVNSACINGDCLSGPAPSDYRCDSFVGKCYATACPGTFVRLGFCDLPGFVCCRRR